MSLEEQAVLGKTARHLIPLMGIMYLVSFLDRVNVSYAALTMNADIGFSASAFGLGAGMFFIGYFLFEIPSNHILHRRFSGRCQPSPCRARRPLPGSP